jgi:hypothetical protein
VKQNLEPVVVVDDVHHIGLDLVVDIVGLDSTNFAEPVVVDIHHNVEILDLDDLAVVVVVDVVQCVVVLVVAVNNIVVEQVVFVFAHLVVAFEVAVDVTIVDIVPGSIDYSIAEVDLDVVSVVVVEEKIERSNAAAAVVVVVVAG